ncbi:MAG: DUF1667 domain-containing protein [Synergistetes bacterium]|nr:DUF1667 domain-containing protein [Synergistota bacterium]
MKKEIICLQCPLACRMTVELTESGEILSVSGNSCPRGEEYAEQEIKQPLRILTTTVRVLSKDIEHPRLPVRTQGLIPKVLLKKCMKTLASVEVRPPVRVGDVVLENILSTGVDVISTAEVLE